MLRLLLVWSALFLYGCTSIRYGLAPQKEPTIVEYFGSQAEANEFLTPFVSASVDVVSGISPALIEHARKTGDRILFGDQSSIASGTIVEGGAIVLTAAHVLRNGEPYVLIGRGSDVGFVTEAELVWCSESADLAALRPARTLPNTIEWLDRPEIGQTVFLIGIFGRHSVGQVVGIDEVSPGILTIKHSAPIRGGDSGGPLLTESGELAAINTRIEFGAIRYAYSEGRRLGQPFDGNDCFDSET